MKPAIQVYTGGYFDYRFPEQQKYDIRDIAHALSNLCRYTGHGEQFYSVAQHSVLVSRVIAPQHALVGLLHDAAEAYIGDVNSPLKTLLPEYRALEGRIEAALFRSYGLHPLDIHLAKHSDLRLLATEKRDLLAHNGADTTYWALLDGVEPCEFVIRPETPHIAERRFLERYRELTRDQD